MRKLYLSIYLLGLLLFFSSIFGNVTPTEMTNNSVGREVKTWEPGILRHSHLALDPLLEAIELMNVINVPSKYGYGGNGDGYEWYLKQTIKRFFYSIPVCIGWITILVSILSIWQIWKQTINQSKLKCFVKVGSIFMLLAVPLLANDFYDHAITQERYFHLGMGAYFIVSAYLLIGIALLKLLEAKRVNDTANTETTNFGTES